MRIGILSDIHGNLEAFRAVLDHMMDQAVDRMISLGDNVGYGPEPEAVTHLLRKREISSVLGNHELALTAEDQLDWFNHDAKTSLIWTRSNLSGASCKYLVALPTSRVVKRCRFVHGFPPDSPTRYLFQVADTEIIRTLREMREWIAFTGHTHCLQLISRTNGIASRGDLHPGVITLDPAARYIVNAGSVGQPRDGDPRAKYLVLDTRAATLQVCAVAYDVDRVIQKILAAGLPDRHADRLR
jgi:predicted phosphodiesterase